jgi:hypothetical protein
MAISARVRYPSTGEGQGPSPPSYHMYVTAYGVFEGWFQGPHNRLRLQG